MHWHRHTHARMCNWCTLPQSSPITISPRLITAPALLPPAPLVAGRGQAYPGNTDRHGRAGLMCIGWRPLFPDLST